MSNLHVNNITDRTVQIALYKWPVSFENDYPYKIVQSNKDNKYMFNHVKSGEMK